METYELLKRAKREMGLADNVPRQTASGGSQPTQQAGGDAGARALAELTARTGQMPDGTPTQRGIIMQGMASDPALLAQFEQTRMEPIRAQAKTILSAVDDLLGPDGTTLTPGGQALFGSMTPVWSRDLGVRDSTVAANASLRQIVGQRVVDLIREMKGQSQTGATGFGQLNTAELDIILSAATRLTQRLPEADAAAELAVLREKFKKIMQPSSTTATPRRRPGELPTSQAPSRSPSGGVVTVQTPDGAMTFPDQKSADDFKKAAGL